MKAKESPKFETTWEGRSWVDWGRSDLESNKSRDVGGFKFMTYHIYADRKCMNIKYSTSKTWLIRRETQLQEIISYDADIFCVQDVDHYLDWWQTRLMVYGYDSIFKQRTSEEYDHVEGVMICYRRDLFQLFKTVEVEFNRAGDHGSVTVKKACITDDVGLIVFLQPWQPNFLSSALCVTCAMLYDGKHDPKAIDVRSLQVIYLTKQIEYENRSFHLPVVMGISLHDKPDSSSYHILRTGRKQLMPRAPSRCDRPKILPFSRASVKVLWRPAEITEADPPVLKYIIAWRPGGSRDLGFCFTKVVQSGDCIQYTTSHDSKGIRSTVAQEYRSTVVRGLSAETPFEFKIAAVNSIGRSDWSDASYPILLKNPPKVSASSVFTVAHIYIYLSTYYKFILYMYLGTSQRASANVAGDCRS
jgi:hypothetical protein